MKLKKKKLNKDKVAFKRRGVPLTKKLYLSFGTHGIFSAKAARFELIYFVILRKILKKHRKYVKDRTVYPKRIWFWLRKNYIVSKKSKNARMGKGKGKFLRYAVYIVKNSIVLEFYGWHLNSIKSVTSKFSKKITLNLDIVYNTNMHILHKSCCNNYNYSYQLIKKYFNQNFV